MISYEVKNWEGEPCGSVELPLKVAREESAAHVVHRTLVAQEANARQGNACTKTRAEVRGGGRKPFKQKGTGRARAGSSRSPLKPGGGVIFGPKPRSFNLKVNRKERKLAIRTAIASRADDTQVVEPFLENLQAPKTKEFVNALSRWGLSTESKILIVVTEISDLLYLSSRNIQKLQILKADSLNVRDILGADRLVITSESLEVIKEVYG